ncbi:MAG: hypothetical protein HY801_08550 [Candidatus Lindowbacteria bacterium]|nr:hypothetical protein [Candidatus Lindowbacteria bacterium]
MDCITTGHDTYDAQVGRFLGRDPINEEDSVNRYWYVENRPLMFSDPTGLSGPPPHKQNCDSWKEDRKAQCPGGSANLVLTCQGCCDDTYPTNVRRWRLCNCACGASNGCSMG